MNDQYGAGGVGSGGMGGAPAPSALDVGDVFATTFRALGSAFMPIFTAAFLVIVPAAFVGFVVNVVVFYATRDLLVNGSGDTTRTALASLLGLGAMLGMLIVLLFTQSIGQGSIVYAVVETLSGRAPQIGASLRMGFSRAPTLVMLNLLGGAVGLVVMLVFIGPALVAAFAMPDQPAISVVLSFGGIAALAVIGTVAWVYLFPAQAACVAEKLGPIASLRRAVELTEGNRLTIFLVILAGFVFALVMICCIVMPLQTLVVGGAAAASGGDLTALQNPLSAPQIIGQFVSIPLQVIEVAVMSTLTSVVYARLRGVRDGVDAQSIASVFA